MRRLKNLKNIADYDGWLLFSIGMLLTVGCVLVCTSTPFLSEKVYHLPWYYFIRHLLHIVLGVFAFCVACCVSTQTIVKYRWLLVLMGFLVLAVVLIPGVSPRINGAKRWLALPGFMVQTSDIAKLCMVMFLAAFFSKNRYTQHRTWYWYVPLGLVLSYVLLLLLQPDFGAAMVLMLVVMQVMFLAGMPFSMCARMIGGVSFFMVLMMLVAPYRLQRLASFLNPWKYALSSGYQLTQSLMAIGRGGLWGVGAGEGVQKIFYLPEAHTDFVFAVLCEEFGMIAALAVIILLMFVIVRLLYWSWFFHHKGKQFSALYAAGLSSWFAAQSVISIGVNIGLFPTKGLALPFISYGGSHMLVMFCAFGVLFSMIQEVRGSQRIRKKHY